MTRSLGIPLILDQCGAARSETSAGTSNPVEALNSAAFCSVRDGRVLSRISLETSAPGTDGRSAKNRAKGSMYSLKCFFTAGLLASVFPVNGFPSR